MYPKNWKISYVALKNLVIRLVQLEGYVKGLQTCGEGGMFVEAVKAFYQNMSKNKWKRKSETYN